MFKMKWSEYGFFSVGIRPELLIFLLHFVIWFVQCILVSPHAQHRSISSEGQQIPGLSSSTINSNTATTTTTSISAAPVTATAVATPADVVNPAKSSISIKGTLGSGGSSSKHGGTLFCFYVLMYCLFRNFDRRVILGLVIIYLPLQSTKLLWWFSFILCSNHFFTGTTPSKPAAVSTTTNAASAHGNVGLAAQQWVNCSVCTLDVTWPYVLHSDASRAIVAHNCRYGLFVSVIVGSFHVQTVIFFSFIYSNYYYF